MNTANPIVTPRNFRVEVKTSGIGDPLRINLSEGGSLGINDLVALLSVRILEVGNRLDGIARLIAVARSNKMHLEKATAEIRDIQTLASVIRDLQRWPLHQGQRYAFKYGNVLYAVDALSPAKYEELERAKDHYLKPATIKLTGKFNSTEETF